MNIVADENVDKEIVDRLRADGHDVFYIIEQNPGIDDEIVLNRSRRTDAVLLTADKDFGVSFSVSACCTRVLCSSVSPVSGPT